MEKMKKMKKLALLPLAFLLCAGTVKIRQTGQSDVYVPTMDSTNSSNLTIDGNLTIKKTFQCTILSASQALFTDGSKNIVSNAITGTGNVVMSASPTLSGTIAGTPTFSSAITFTTAPILSSTTASQALFTNASKNVVSNAITGTGNVVMSASPTLSGTITGGTFSGTHTGDGSGVTNLNMGNASSGTLAVVRGGTGVTTSTGTGSNVLNTAPAFSGVPTGTITSGTYAATITNRTIPTFTLNSTATGWYSRIGNYVCVRFWADISTGGAAGGYVSVSLPVAGSLSAVTDIRGHQTWAYTSGGYPSSGSSTGNGDSTIFYHPSYPNTATWQLQTGNNNPIEMISSGLFCYFAS